MSTSFSDAGRTWFRPWMLAAGAALIAGCVSQSGTETEQTFTYNRMIPIGIFLGGCIAIPIGFFWRKSDARIGWGLMIIVPLAAFLGGATMWFERVNINDQRIEIHAGMFGSGVTTIPLDQVKQIRVVEESTRGRRPRLIDVLYFMGDAGEVGTLRLSNDVNTEASRAILDRANARGIAVILK